MVMRERFRKFQQIIHLPSVFLLSLFDDGIVVAKDREGGVGQRANASHMDLLPVGRCMITLRFFFPGCSFHISEMSSDDSSG